jgi:hypothetical protein
MANAYEENSIWSEELTFYAPRVFRQRLVITKIGINTNIMIKKEKNRKKKLKITVSNLYKLRNQMKIN